MIERDKYLLPEEFKQLLNAVRTKDRNTYSLILLGGNLGLRVGELVQMRRSDFLMKDGLVRVRTLKQRRGTTHEISSDRRTAREVQKLLKRRKESDHLFPGRVEGHMSTRTAQNRFKKACRMARLDRDYSIHSLRHYRGIMLYETSKDIYWTKDQLRHASVRNTEIYMHISPSKREEMRKRMGKLTVV